MYFKGGELPKDTSKALISGFVLSGLTEETSKLRST